MARVAAVTVTYNSGTVLEPFLRCCLRQTHPDYALYVIDNASRDGTLALLDTVRDPRVHVTRNADNLGVAEGNNQGIRAALAAGYDRVLLINNDTEFGETLFADLEAVLDARGASAVTPRIVYYDHQDQDWFAQGGFTSPLRGVTGRHEPAPAAGGAEVRAIDYAPTCCMLVTADAFRRIGLMDEKYFVYWDDTDFCWRLKTGGESLLVAPSVVLAHKVSSLTGGLASDFFIRYHYRNQMYFVKKHFGPLVAAYTAALLCATILARIVARGDSLRMCRLRLASLWTGIRMPVGPAT